MPELGVAYGAGINYYGADIFRAAGATVYPALEGVAHSLSAGLLALDDSSPGLGLVYSPTDSFVEWCPLQQSLPEGDGDFNCAGAAGFGGGDPTKGELCTLSTADGDEQDVDCNFVSLCTSGACSCDEAGCRAANPEALHQLWLAREGDQLIGYLAGALFQRGDWTYLPIGTIRFERELP